MGSIYSNLLAKKQVFTQEKEFSSHKAGFERQHGCCFVVLKHQYGRCEVMWKRSTGRLLFESNLDDRSFN